MADRVDIREVTGASIAAVMARKGVTPATIGTRLDVSLASAPGTAASGDLTLIGTGPGTWLARADRPAADWCEGLAGKLAGVASVSDVSEAYRIFHVSGADARTLLQRGAFLDFHPDAFAPGDVAITMIAHIGVIVRQLDDAPTFELAVFRSLGESFRHWLDTAAASL